MTFDDMPADTVLRCTDGEFLGLIVVRDECGWTSAGSEGRCVPSDFGNAWVELVEKPATSPLSAEDAYAVEAINRGDAEIASGVTGVPLETVLAQYPEVK